MTSPDHTANAPPHDPQAATGKWGDARAAGNQQRAREERDALSCPHPLWMTTYR